MNRAIDSLTSGNLLLSDKLFKKDPSQPLTEIERETLHVNINYGNEIDGYQRELENEPAFSTS